MNRIVRVFQNSWPGLRSKPIQRYRPAAKKRGGEVAIVMILNAKNHDDYGRTLQRNGESVGKDNADEYLKCHQRPWNGTAFEPGEADPPTDYVKSPVPDLIESEKYWKPDRSIDWNGFRDQKTVDHDAESGKPHRVPIYVLWNRGYSLRKIQGVYNEDAIEQEWQELVDLYEQQYYDYFDVFLELRLFYGYGEYGHYLWPFPNSIQEDNGELFYQVPQSYLDWGPGNDNCPRDGQLFDNSIYDGGGVYVFRLSVTTRSIMEDPDKAYEYVRKKHRIRKERWVLDKHEWTPPREVFWDTSDPNYPEGKWNSDESKPFAWGDDYNCWDKEISPRDISDILEHNVYENGERIGGYELRNIELPNKGPEVDDWYSAIGLSGDVDIFGNTTHPDSASGKANKSLNIGLYIDENDLPSHVKHSYHQFKNLVEGQQADPAGKNIRVYCMTPEDWGDGGSSAHLEAAHSVVRYLFSLQGEESDQPSPNNDLPDTSSDDLSEPDLLSEDVSSIVEDDSYENFLSNWSESDEVWLDYRSFHDDPADARWFRTAQDALDYAEEDFQDSPWRN